MTTLEFVNSDATPKKAVIQCAPGSVAQIMAWYGAHYAGGQKERT